MDLSKLSLEQLLGDLQVVVREAPTVTEMWINDQGYYPGQTRMKSQELYIAFRAWATQQADIAGGDIPGISVWGVEMTGRFKKGRSNRGLFYYISREAVATYPTK